MRSRDEGRFSGRLWLKWKLSYAPEVRARIQMISKNRGVGRAEEAIHVLVNTAWLQGAIEENTASGQKGR